MQLERNRGADLDLKQENMRIGAEVKDRVAIAKQDRRMLDQQWREHGRTLAQRDQLHRQRIKEVCMLIDRQCAAWHTLSP